MSGTHVYTPVSTCPACLVEGSRPDFWTAVSRVAERWGVSTSDMAQRYLAEYHRNNHPAVRK